MLQERPNEPNQWQNRLSELDSVAGEPVLDKTAAWNKLHDRLSNKKPNKKTIWYMLAAACLVAVLLSPWIFTTKEQIVPVSENKVTPSKLLHEPVTNNNVAPPYDSKPQKKNPSEPGLTSKKQHIITPKKAIAEELLSPPETLKIASVELPDNSNNALHAIDSSSVSVVIQLPAGHKKLKVVHINEIENPSSLGVDYATLKFNSYKTKKLRKARSSNLYLSKNSSDDLVKIQLSPSN